jgi:predicted RNase H-like HicB family nuclease
MKDYHINIFYNEEDQCYVADVPDLTKCTAFGPTATDALLAVEKAKQEWLEAAGKEGRQIPEPQYRPEIYAATRMAPPNGKPAEVAADAGPAFDAKLKFIADKVSKRECILFLGSAIHVPPAPDDKRFNYTSEKAPPIGSQLSKHLANIAGYPGQDWWNLQRVSQHFESTLGRALLVSEIGKAVHEGREPSPVLRMLAELEFPIVITTNYDNLYEQDLAQKTVSVYSNTKAKTLDCLQVPDPKNPYVLKIHGDISKPASIVVTDEDYIQFVLRMGDKTPYHPFGNNVLAHLMKWPTLFIGYSLMDYNLRLLFKTLRWKSDAAQIPPTYSVDKKPDYLIRDVWENQRRYISFIVLNLWDFVPKLHSLVKKEVQP